MGARILLYIEIAALCLTIAFAIAGLVWEYVEWHSPPPSTETSAESTDDD
jgi:hypothetical protein